MIEDIHLMDCMEGMKEFPDNHFDIAIVDPPYGIGEDGSKNKSRGTKRAPAKNYKPFAGNDKKPASIEYFKELHRISKNTIIWGANHFISQIKDKDSSCWIVWDKENGSNDFADCELAKTTFKTAVSMFRFKWSGFMQGDMKNKELRIHPTQKPVKLYEWILSNYTKKGYKILDTHLGSGSIACAIINMNNIEKMNLKLTAYELDEHYYNSAIKRIKNHQKQLTIF